MNQFIEFLKEYWFQLATGIFAVVEVILLIIKRRPKSLDDFKLALLDALAAVPDYVCQVEVPGNGAEKRAKVLKACVALISKKLGRSLTDSEVALVSQSIIEQVETVLSTPTKKEI